MEQNWTKKLVAMGLVAGLTVGGLTACGDGVDQDNGISDGEQKDQVDKDHEVDED